ncbi:MAG: hypothetical protein DSM106950_13965 [Stigonema ocellatum SAG 48.90 = DSM 106950]|nr:hypothetical protein [Stigonema ocellatum SAG 48.90 = DSM 106950]
MNLKIRRRQFGQLALASATTAVIANLGGKVAAQKQQTLYSVRVSKLNSISDPVNTTPQIILKSSNVTTGQELLNSEIASTTVSNVSTAVETVEKSISTQPSERLTGVTTLSDGTLVSTSVLSSKSGNVTRLSVTNPNTSQTTNSLKVSGFPNNNSTVESLLSTKDNKLIGVISLNEGTPPFDLAIIDRATGKVTLSTEAGLPRLASGRRYSNIVQSPDGKIYATTLGKEGVTTLVQVDMANKSINKVVQLSYNNKPLANDLLSLAISSSGQFYALANPDHGSTNSLFTVDVKTGVLTFVKPLDAEQITFSPA